MSVSLLSLTTTFCKHLYLRFISVVLHEHWLVASFITYLSITLCSIFLADLHAWREGDIGTSDGFTLRPCPIKWRLPYVMHMRKHPSFLPHLAESLGLRLYLWSVAITEMKLHVCTILSHQSDDAELVWSFSFFLTSYLPLLSQRFMLESEQWGKLLQSQL